jgi:formate dehydrogenase major subunit
MTNHWSDMVHAHVILIMGGNPAENHPIAMRWLERAKQGGAVLIHVDPRYNRSSQVCDVWAQMRSGTDIAFVGGMIHHALSTGRIHEEYVRSYTNASWLVREDFAFDPESGLFSGYDPEKSVYDRSSWQFDVDEEGHARTDPTLQDPRCVFQQLKRHFARYDPVTVCRITGTDERVYRRVCDLFTSTHAPDRAGTWLYAMGTAQHTHGAQNIRTYAILQLLLGNVGVAGGGINAMRGESNVQGSTDMGLLFHVLPGYLDVPREADQTLEQYLARITPKALSPDATNWLQNSPKYAVSMLKAFWGKNATEENGFAFDHMPRVGAGWKGAGYSTIPLFQAMYAGQIKGAFCFGQNCAVGGPNAQLVRAALDKLEWLVIADLFPNETVEYWKRPGVDPAKIGTEVFVLPAAASMEKEGSIVNSGRWMQWRYRVAEPPGDARADLDIVVDLVRALKKAYASGGAHPAPILDGAWDYGEGHVDVHRIAKEINGRYEADVTTDDGKTFRAGTQVDGFPALRDDGSTSSGCWLYCGSYTENGNMAARRDASDAANAIGLMPKWAWVWPMNRRILYNRASVDANGQPFRPDRWVIRWNAEEKKWEGDIPDGGSPPGGPPFIMLKGGVGQLFAPEMTDGPFPEHYEPAESPVQNPLSRQQIDPVVKVWSDTPFDKLGTAEEFPIVATTYRVSEHWQTGSMSRYMPWLVALTPDAFCEIGADLARTKGIETGDRIRVRSARGAIVVYALVTERFQAMRVAGKRVDQVGIPWHWGYSGLSPGDSANVLTANVGDANTMIPEYKAFLVDVELVEKKRPGGHA